MRTLYIQVIYHLLSHFNSLLVNFLLDTLRVKMKEYINDRGFCYFHPRELVVGICASCLNERLLVLASNQPHHNKASRRKYNSLPKIFALTSLLNRMDIKHQKSELYYTSSTSPEDSFISIKFEENGVASWDKGKISKMPPDQQCREISMKESLDKGKEIKSVVEHTKPRTVLRWRKRIGHLFQVIRWKRSSKGNVSHVGTKLGAKVRYSWLKTLTKRRTNQE